MNKTKYTFEDIEPSFVNTQHFEYKKSKQSIFPVYSEVNKTTFKNDQELKDYIDSYDFSFTEDTTNFLNHDLHPYPAKYIPQLPGSFISILSQKGEVILDPFGGSGTTALEAMRLGRKAISIDANPVAILIGKVKTALVSKEVSNELHILRGSLMSIELKELENTESIIELNKSYIPEIPNLEKWFSSVSIAELSIIKSHISKIKNETAKDISLLALSKIILFASNQDSETRYTSVEKSISSGDVISKYIKSFNNIISSITSTQSEIGYSSSDFILKDSRDIDSDVIADNSVDLIVTSPPYGNAMDYHLYHRFRMFWLGYNPKDLYSCEIGSHLKHQKEKTGFEDYLTDMKLNLEQLYRILRPGKYAVFVVGDSVYKGESFFTANELSVVAENMGFEVVTIKKRELHKTKRSFQARSRRASHENILVIRKPDIKISIQLIKPKYKLWSYENDLRDMEIKALLSPDSIDGDNYIISTNKLNNAKKLVFTSEIIIKDSENITTWQSILENSSSGIKSSRKDPKYVTHGIHNYKGKFYPQLAKSLINISNVKEGSNIFDPFCGSGTTLLEGFLNGYNVYGIDMNPLAAKISKAKVGILTINPSTLREVIISIKTSISENTHNNNDLTEFPDNTHDEIMRWFAEPIIKKLNHLLCVIREASNGIVRDFLEVILSSIIITISHQDPTDLRIRKRKELLKDIDVYELYFSSLENQFKKIHDFWQNSSHSSNYFYNSNNINSDSRLWDSYKELGIQENSIDLIVTSPPYATALPYIDTDRLSLLSIMGIPGSIRRPLEQNIIGSREITKKNKDIIESEIINDTELPLEIIEFIKQLSSDLSETTAGFRRQNMPTLLYRFFIDMKKVLENCHKILKPGSSAYFVIGDNKTKVFEDYRIIPTTHFIDKIAVMLGFESLEPINISVSTENLKHIKHSIKNNIILHLRKKV